MRAIHFVLLGWAALGGVALAQEVGNAAKTAAEKTDVAPIHFDLAATRSGRPESLPTAATLDELTYATSNRPATNTAPQATPMPQPRPAPPPARKVVAARPANGPWMSEWRRAYIVKHGHPPPVAAR